jgi:hypothetical protein
MTVNNKYLRLVNGIARMTLSPVASEIYDQTTVIVGTVTTGTNLTLPSSGTYTNAELKVDLNGILLEPVIDYNYVGSAPRTQIQATFDLIDGDRLRFKIGD